MYQTRSGRLATRDIGGSTDSLFSGGKLIIDIEGEAFVATAVLMREQAERRLLLMLSDGKSNDVENYEGRTGVKDMRQAVQEASLVAGLIGGLTHGRLPHGSR